MSHILLFGAGPLPFEPADRHYAVCKRTWQFLQPLLEDGHRVTAICLLVPGARVEPGPRPYPSSWSYQLVRSARLEDMAWVQAVHDRVEPDAVAGVGALLPRRAAAKLRTPAPRWLDMFGSAMAEAQARAALEQRENGKPARWKYPRSKRPTSRKVEAPDPFWDTEAAALESGDAFSAVSERQRIALIGELGCAGRLNADTFGRELVHVVPCSLIPTPASSPPGPPLRGGAIGSRDFVVLWSGGFNTWADPETLFEGLEQAMDSEPRLHFVSSGGELFEHDAVTYQTLRERVRGSKHSRRFHLLGWIPQSQLAGLYRQADVGINVDRWCYEALLGSRSRILDWLAAGLPVVTTDITELAQEVCRAGLGFSIPVGDPAALAQRLIELARDPEALRQARERASDWVQGRYSIEATIGCWRRWASEPRFAADAARLREPLESDQKVIQPTPVEKDLAPIPVPRAGYPARTRRLLADARLLNQTAKRFHRESKELHLKLHQRNLEVDALQRELDQRNHELSGHQSALDTRNRELERSDRRLHELGSEAQQLHQRLHQLGEETQQLHQRLHQRNLDYEAELAAHQRSRTELERVSASAAELEQRLGQRWHRFAEWLIQGFRGLRARLGFPAHTTPTDIEPEPHSGRER